MMSWFPVNISNFIYAIQSGFFGGLPTNDPNAIGDSSTAPPSVTTTTPNIDQSKSSTSVVHLVTTCVLYLNTIINPMIYAMSASSMRNRILTSIRPRPGINGPSRSFSSCGPVRRSLNKTKFISGINFWKDKRIKFGISGLSWPKERVVDPLEPKCSQTSPEIPGK